MIPTPSAHWCAGSTVNVQELEAEIVRLREQLQPYLDAEAEAGMKRVWQERLELLVKICIPNYCRMSLDARNEKYPIRHPQTAGWWNGASIVDTHLLANGDVRVEVKSYIGGNEYDEEEITLRKEWFEVTNPTEVVQKWCVEETDRNEKFRIEYARQDALRRIESLNEQLKLLEKLV